jgi:GxxExxY protein
MKRRDAESAENEHNVISRRVIGAAIQVHSALGPGLLESAYAACLATELRLQGIRFKREVPLPVGYKGVKIDNGYRIDFVVEGLIIVELKTVDRLHLVHLTQLLTYLRLADLRLGLLINFNVAVLRDGLRRVVNHL